MCDVYGCRSRQEVVFVKGKGVCFKHWGLAYVGKIRIEEMLR